MLGLHLQHLPDIYLPLYQTSAGNNCSVPSGFLAIVDLVMLSSFTRPRRRDETTSITHKKTPLALLVISLMMFLHALESCLRKDRNLTSVPNVF